MSDFVLHSDLETILSLGSWVLIDNRHHLVPPSVTETNTLMIIILRSIHKTHTKKTIYIVLARRRFLNTFTEKLHIATTVLGRVNDTTRLMFLLVLSSPSFLNHNSLPHVLFQSHELLRSLPMFTQATSR